MTVHDGDQQSARRRERALALVAAAAGIGDADDAVGLARDLRSLCRAATSHLEASGAAVNLRTGSGPDWMVASADDLSRRVGELPFTVGEGPCLDAFALGRPVLVRDLAATARRQWVGYAPSALALGVSAVFAVPLGVGAVRLGVFELYADRPRFIEGEDLAMVLTFAMLGTEMLLGGRSAPAGEGLDTRLNVALDHRAEVHQAQGMVMVDLGIDLAEALVRMRAHAFSHSVPLIDLAHQIIAGYVLPGGTEG